MANQIRNAATRKTKPANEGKKISKAKNRKTAKDGDNLPIQDLNALFPPLGSEAAEDQSANKEATDIVKAIYHDLNFHCNWERIATNENPFNQQGFQNLLYATEKFVAQEMSDWKACVESFKSQDGEFQSVSPVSRFFDFIDEHGWKMFAICAHAEAFRRWFRPASDRVWGFVCEQIHENKLSIEVYAHNHGLKWRNALLNYQGSPVPGLPDLKPVIETYTNWKVDHPHHTVITLDGKLKEPVFQGHLQQHINEHMFNPTIWNGKPDPTLRREREGRTHGVGSVCFLCGSEVSCDCQLQSRAGELIELTEYPNRGTGVRALTDFRRHDVLGEFVGELIPNCTEDWMYPLTQTSDHFSNPSRIVCTIAPHRFGNWTRFINHSCEPSTWFVTRTIGKRVVTTIEAVRDIKAFEEITVDYGRQYWHASFRQCLCGQANCISEEE